MGPFPYYPIIKLINVSCMKTISTALQMPWSVWVKRPRHTVGLSDQLKFWQAPRTTHYSDCLSNAKTETEREKTEERRGVFHEMAFFMTFVVIWGYLRVFLAMLCFFVLVCKTELGNCLSLPFETFINSYNSSKSMSIICDPFPWYQTQWFNI